MPIVLIFQNLISDIFFFAYFSTLFDLGTILGNQAAVTRVETRNPSGKIGKLDIRSTFYSYVPEDTSFFDAISFSFPVTLWELPGSRR